MKIVFLTPGTGSYFCGACMRDNALARELVRAGHDVTIAPMYLPLMLDDSALPGLSTTPIFFGGINVYLQQKIPLFRKTPAFFDRLINTRPLLRWAARYGHMTSAREHGALALEMLQVGSNHFRKESDKLLDWLGRGAKPDLVCLSTALLAGFATGMKQRFGAPVVTFFQGEDSFLDGLPEPYRSQCWVALTERLKASDRLIAPSRFYATFIRGRLGLAPDEIEVVHNGISLDGLGGAGVPPAATADAELRRDARVPQTIGYLARMSRDKGLDILVDAFIALARDFGDASTRLKIAGAATAGDEPFIVQLKRRIAEAGLENRVEWAPNITREQKFDFLRSLTLFSVPAVYAEAFGLYVIEAMASGVPVVQPDSAAFPEIIGMGGGGVCVPPCDAVALARAWQQLLGDRGAREKLSREGRLSVEKHFTARTMGEQFSLVVDQLTRTTA